MEAKRKISQVAIGFLARKCNLTLGEINEALVILNDRPYKIYQRPKKSGGYRIIHEPKEELMIVQDALLKFFYHWQIHYLLYGFQPGRSLVSGAEMHLLEKKVPRWVLKIDLKDAFPSVTAGYLFDLFSEMIKAKYGYERGMNEKLCQEVAYILVCLTTYRRRVIQGAPTSPYLLNLTLTHLGIVDRIVEICGNRKKPFNFTVYADDFVISSTRAKIPIKRIIEVINRSGLFRVNPDKTRISRSQWRAHFITGISLTLDRYGQPKLTLPQKKIKIIRGKVHRATQILSSGRLPFEEEDGMNIGQVMGWIGWVKYACQGNLPSGIRKVILNFERAWDKHKKEHVF